MSAGQQQAGQMGKSMYAYHGEGYFMGLKAIRRHPGVTPMVVIIGGLVVFVTSACSYFMATKSDVMVDRKRRWETVNLDNPAPQKVFTIQQQYRPMPDLKKLLDEINEADRK